MNAKQNDETTTVAACPPLSGGLGMNWSKDFPILAGMYLWSATGSICIVRVPRADTTIGIVVQGHDFYDRCKLQEWGGEWFGPIPERA